MSLPLAAASALTADDFAKLTVAKLREFLQHPEVVEYVPTDVKLNSKTTKPTLIALCLAAVDNYREEEEQRATHLADVRRQREAREASENAEREPLTRPARQIGKSAHLSALAQDVTTSRSVATPAYLPSSVRVDNYRRQNDSLNLTPRQARRLRQKSRAGK